MTSTNFPKTQTFDQNFGMENYEGLFKFPGGGNYFPIFGMQPFSYFEVLDLLLLSIT